MATRNNYSRPLYNGEPQRALRREQQGRNPNDIRVNPASPEVISNMLDSFSIMPPPGEEPSLPQPPKKIPTTPPRSIQSNTSKRRAKGRVSPTPDPSADFEEHSHPYIKQQDLPPQEDAAEPPVVRIARPPSGMSRVSSYRAPTTKSASSRSPSIPSTPQLRTPNPERQDQLSPLRATSTERKRGQISASGRSSIEVSRNTQPQEGAITSTQSIKGKEKLRESPIQNSSNATSDIQQGEGPTTPERASSLRSRAKKSNLRDTLDAQETARSGLVRPKSPRADSRTKRTYIADDTQADAAGPSRASRDLLGEASRSQSRRDHYRDAVPEQQEDDDSDSAMPSPVIQRYTKSSRDATEDGQAQVDLEEETDVSRRIKELKAAKEERRKSLAAESRNSPAPPTAPAPMSSITTSLSPPIEKPPETSLASKQLAEAQKVEERPIVSNMVNGSSSPRIGSGVVTPTATKAAAGMQPPSRRMSVSESVRSAKSTKSWKERLLPSARNTSKAKASMDQSRQETPAASRPGSRSKRYSVANFASPRKSDVSRTHTRHGSTEERRGSSDSINLSVSEFLQDPRLSQKIVVSEEHRVISFSEVGDPDGHVVFCCVGMGLTRYVTAFYDELATSLRLRLITPERPGIGDSTPRFDGSRIPLAWPDDVQAICRHLRIREFALLAHSAGAIYALATALRMPQRVRCKIHLLAPWIPPSQMSSVGLPQSTPQPTGSLPRTHKFLRLIPTPFLKLSNSGFGFSSLSRKESSAPKHSDTAGGRPATSHGASPTQPSARPSFGPPTPRLNDDGTFSNEASLPNAGLSPTPRLNSGFGPNSPTGVDAPQSFPSNSSALRAPSPSKKVLTAEEARDRQRRFDMALTPRIWELARHNGNPAVDLLVCIERNQAIGFRYVDIHRAVIIHHGTKDTRVPIENAKWLGKTMRRAEVRALDGEGHSLMGNAGVMSNVLTELSKEWDETASIRSDSSSR